MHICRDVHIKNFGKWKGRATFPVVGLQATGFTREKSVKLKTQFLATVKIETLYAKINFIVAPKLLRECIFGINARRALSTFHGAEATFGCQ